jgi:hypothetical protein
VPRRILQARRSGEAGELPEGSSADQWLSEGYEEFASFLLSTAFLWIIYVCFEKNRTEIYFLHILITETEGVI